MSISDVDLGGLEFDWFVLDPKDNIAVLSSAGQGFIPDIVLNNHERYDNVWQNIESPNWGSENVWNDYANLGLYVYDWYLNGGPYIKKANPKGSLELSLRNEILAIGELPKLQALFEELDEIRSM